MRRQTARGQEVGVRRSSPLRNNSLEVVRRQTGKQVREERIEFLWAVCPHCTRPYKVGYTVRTTDQHLKYTYGARAWLRLRSAFSHGCLSSINISVRVQLMPNHHNGKTRTLAGKASTHHALPTIRMIRLVRHTYRHIRVFGHSTILTQHVERLMNETPTEPVEASTGHVEAPTEHVE